MSNFKMLEMLERAQITVWTQISNAKASGDHLKKDCVSVGFTTSKKDNPKVDKVVIRIGADVIRELGWQDKNLIALFNDPDDEMRFMLCSTTLSSGYKLQKEKLSDTHFIQFSWRGKTKLPFRRQKEVLHAINSSKQLLIKVDLDQSSI